MKKQLLLFTFSFFLLPIAFAQTYAWQDISDNIPVEADLSDVFFVSDDEGWITTSSYAEIYHTTDGGATFEVQTTQYECNAIYMINENEGYAGGQNGRVYKTTNGGENWVAIGTIGVTLSDIDFASPTQGYCCGDNGKVYSITSEGAENLNSELASDLAGVSAPFEDNVWVCGGNNIVHFDGANWGFQTGPVGTYNAIHLIHDNEGWVVGNSGIIGHTENGGNTWENQAPANPSDESLFDVFFLTDEIGWAVGATGTIISTSTSGVIWSIVGSDLTTSLLRGIQFTSPTNGYVVGNENTILKYSEVVGIGEDTEALPFDIYPNPAVDKCKIKRKKAKGENALVEIFDLNGRLLLKKQFPARTEEIEIDVSHLPGGVYGCKLITENNSVTKKLIIQK